MGRRVVVTGMGIWSCLGTNLEEVRESLYEGRSGIGVDPQRIEYGYQSALTGIVQQPALKGLLHRRMRVGLSEEAEYAYMAARECFGQAGVDDDFLLQHEVGVIFGNDSSAKPVIEAANIMAEKHDSELLGSGLIFQSMNSTVNMNLSTIFHLRGINFTISAACASGSHSIGIGYLLIKQGLQDRVLVGGAQETNFYSMATFDALGAFSKRMDEPTKASRPFDRDRDGLIPSGGAAALLLEDYDSAGQYQVLLEGCYIAMSRALDDAGLTVDDIDYVNAHATSTPQGDQFEAMALGRLFDGKRALISSTKGLTGHECWMAGASEAVYSILMMQHSFVAPNVNFEHPDAYSEKLNLATTTVETEVNTVLSNSFGFGGTNSALVLRKLTD